MRRGESLLSWLKQDALPIWWEKGADHERGGFHELLAQEGAPVAADRRARVQARQIYSYAVGGRLGWTGPWKEAVRHGLEFFIGRYRMQTGLFRTLVHADGSPADDTVWLYDQAFALLALSEAAKTFPERNDFTAMAHGIVAALAHRRLQAGGFREAATDHPYQSNPHMHLFEACLAWAEIDHSPIWNDLADEIAGLALTKFIDANGALHEFFDEAWAFEPGVDGRIVEPGHQFEWAWLLERWSRLRNREDAHNAALRLYEIGVTYGVDRTRGVALDQLLDDFTVYKDGARLWPQTERIKAAVILADDHRRFRPDGRCGRCGRSQAIPRHADARPLARQDAGGRVFRRRASPSQLLLPHRVRDFRTLGRSETGVTHRRARSDSFRAKGYLPFRNDSF